MYFTQIELYNFGLYQGSHIIKLNRVQDEKNIILVGGLNGRGKTTIIEAVFIALYGKRSVKVIQDRNTNAYPQILSDRVNKHCEDEQAYIVISCVLDEESKKNLTIKRSWKKKEKNTVDQLEVWVDGEKDILLAENWSYYIEEILPLSIARFFFFDNERISAIAEEASFEEIKDSIKSIIGVNTVDSLEYDLQKLLKEKAENKEIHQDKELQDAYQAIEKSIEEIEELEKKNAEECNTLRAQIAHISEELEEKEELFWKKGGLLGTEKANYQQKKEELILKKQGLENKLNMFTGNPVIPLLLCKKLVTDSWKRGVVELQEQKLIESRELFQKLFDVIQDKIYNSQILDLEKERMMDLIQDEFEPYIHAKVDAKENFLPSDVTYQMQYLKENRFQESQDDCLMAVKAYQENQEELSQINTHLNNEVNEAELKELHEEIRKMEALRAEKNTELKLKEQEAQQYYRKIEELTKKQTLLFENIANTRQSLDDTNRVVEYAAKSLKVMEEFKKRLQKNKIYSLQKSITASFSHLMGKEKMVEDILIDENTLDIQLIDKNGKEILKSQLSAGEKQIFAIAVLWGLAKCSGYEMPVIIDTPMARLDSIHRKNFISRYLPEASAQVLVLSTDEEVYGDYLNALKPYICMNYTLEYDETNESTYIRDGYFGENLCS